MPRRKKTPDEGAQTFDSDLRVSPTEAPAEVDPYLSREVESPTARSGVETGMALRPSNSLEERSQLRDEFESDAARLLVKVQSTLEELLETGSGKERLTAAKLLLQVNGLLEKRQSVDAETVTSIIAALTKRSPVTIKDVTP